MFMPLCGLKYFLLLFIFNVFSYFHTSDLGNEASGTTYGSNAISSEAKDPLSVIVGGISSIGHSIGRKYEQKLSLDQIFFVINIKSKANNFMPINMLFLIKKYSSSKDTCIY